MTFGFVRYLFNGVIDSQTKALTAKQTHPIQRKSNPTIQPTTLKNNAKAKSDHIKNVEL
jgi:hypothetical protein